MSLVIIVAGGTGTRFDVNKPKQFFPLRGEIILRYAIKAFLSHNSAHSIIVTLPQSYLAEGQKELADLNVFLTEGGATRGESVYKGLTFGLAHNLCADTDAVFIHDAARPFINADFIMKIAAAIEPACLVTPALPITSSLRKKNEDGRSIAVDRSLYVTVQTPQAALAGDLHGAFLLLPTDTRFTFTDESALFDAVGLTVKTVEGREENIKITSKIDLAFAEAVLAL